MKIIIKIILIFNLNYSMANEFIVSSTQPEFPSGASPGVIEGQLFYLWARASGCVTSNYTVEPEVFVNFIDDDVNVFFHNGLGGSTVCASPPPPLYIEFAQINGVDAGLYTLNTYSVPYEDSFPPAVSDYSTYFTGSFDFSVLQGTPAVIDSTTNFGLILFTLIMLISGLFYKRKKSV